VPKAGPPPYRFVRRAMSRVLEPDGQVLILSP
jgi:hypothetical protein